MNMNANHKVMLQRKCVTAMRFKIGRAQLVSLVAALSMGALGSSAAFADQSVYDQPLSPGDSFCLDAELTNYFIRASGSAKDANGSPAPVRWSVWHGPTEFDINHRLFKKVNSSFWFKANVPGDFVQACVNNNSPITVFFELEQRVN